MNYADIINLIERRDLIGIGYDLSDTQYELKCWRMGMIFCGKYPLLLTRIQVSNAGPMDPFVYLPRGLVRVCETDLSHMGKNNGNRNLVCKKILMASLILVQSHAFVEIDHELIFMAILILAPRSRRFELC